MSLNSMLVRIVLKYSEFFDFFLSWVPGHPRTPQDLRLCSGRIIIYVESLITCLREIESGLNLSE